jgi:putative peptidoglycan lipid II flippase
MRGGPGRLGASAARLSIANLAVLVSSFGVTIVVTSVFGADSQTDAFWVARGSADFLIALAVAAGVATIPGLVRATVERSPEAAQRLGRSMLWGTLSVLAPLTVALWLVRPLLVNVLAPGFSEPQRALTVELMAFTLPAAILGGGTAILTAVSNASHRFFVAALAPAVANLAILAVIAIFAANGVAAWAAGYALGMLAALVLQAVSARRTIPLVPPLVVTGELARAIPVVSPYVLLALLLQVGSVAVRVIVSSLPAGTLTALSIALTLANIPLGLFGHALGTAVVPRFAAVAADPAAFSRLFERSYRLLAAVLMPVAAVLIALARPLVHLLFQRGSFDERAAQMTAEALAIYAIGLFAQPLIVASNRALLGASATRTIVILETISILALVGLTGILGEAFLHRGVAAAYSLTVFIAATAYMVMMRARLVAIDHRALVRVTARALLFAAISGAVAAGLVARGDSGTLLDKWLTLVVAGLAAAATYVVLLWLSRAEELRDLVGVFRRES